MVHESDRQWIQRSNGAFEYWDGESLELVPGVTLYRTGENCIPGFGARLWRLQRACGYKQAYVAQLAGVNQATVSRWERGNIKPGRKHAEAVLRALSPARGSDTTLRRLVESSTLTAHLINDVDH